MFARAPLGNLGGGQKLNCKTLSCRPITVVKRVTYNNPPIEVVQKEKQFFAIRQQTTPITPLFCAVRTSIGHIATVATPHSFQFSVLPPHKRNQITKLPEVITTGKFRSCRYFKLHPVICDVCVYSIWFIVSYVCLSQFI